MQVHLVDGTYELFRAFFAVPSAQGRGGREVGAARGLLRGFAAWLASGAVTHIAVAFDHVIESFRNRLYPYYKTGEGLDPALLSQFETAERVTRALGIVTWPMVEFEADDALASFAARCEPLPEVERVLICTPDKDLAQCVRGDRVVCLDRMRGKILDQVGVVEKFGVPPSSIPDYLALVGDSADGYPGLPGWGDKSARMVLAQFGELERIPSDSAALPASLRGRDRLARALESQRDQALLFRELARLRLDVPLAESLDDLAWRGAVRSLLVDLCDELGDDSALAKIPRFRDELRLE
jgi:5'-3' exonuclease